jgi:hypothetical protein
MTISAAIDKLFFVASEDYPFYLDCLFGNEVHEEEEEVSEARKTLANAGIKLTDELLAKKKARRANVVPEPTRFIDRPHFKAVEIDELPF